MILSYGKYRGKDLADVPTDYLNFLLRDHETYKKELDRREALKEANSSVTEQLIRSGYRAMAIKCHPDHGGTDESMRAAIIAKEQLLEAVRRGVI